MKTQCEHRKPDGTSCRAYARTDDRFCFFHSPETAHARRKARKAGGIARSKKASALPADTPHKSLRNSCEVCELLAEAINEVRCGKLDPKVANSMGYLAGILLHGLEQGPVEERLARLEASLGLAAKTSRSQSELGMQ